MRLHLVAKSLRSCLVGVLAFGGLACGQLEGDPQRAPVLATIRGQLSNPESYSAGSNLRIAILWGGQDSSDVRVSQDIAAEAVFPSQFKLELRDLPPMSAMRAIGD